MAPLSNPEALCYTRRVIEYLLFAPIAVLVATSALLLALQDVLPNRVPTRAALCALIVAWLATAALWLPLRTGVVTLHLFTWSAVPGLTAPVNLQADFVSYFFALVALIAAIVVVLALDTRVAQLNQALGYTARSASSTNQSMEQPLIEVPSGNTDPAAVVAENDFDNANALAEGPTPATTMVQVAIFDAPQAPANGEASTAAADAEIQAGAVAVECEPEPEPETALAAAVIAESPATQASPKLPSGLSAQTVGLIVLLMAATLMTLFSATLLLFAMAWTVVGILVYALRVASTERTDFLVAAKNHLALDLLAGFCLLAAMVLINHQANVVVPVPFDFTGVPTFSLALLLVPALVRLLQYPFSRAMEQLERTDSPVSGLVLALLLFVSGGYWLARIWPLAQGSAANGFSFVLIAFGLLTIGYGLLAIGREISLEKVHARAIVVHLGLIMAAFGFGTTTAMIAALLLILNDVLAATGVTAILGTRLTFRSAPQNAMGTAMETEHGVESAATPAPIQPKTHHRDNLALAWCAGAAAGVPFSAAFWAHCLLVVAAIHELNILLIVVVLISQTVVLWRMLRALDNTVVTPVAVGDQPIESLHPSWTNLVPAVLLALVAVLPIPLGRYLLEPAAQSISGASGTIATSVDSWAGLIAIILMLVLARVIWQLDPLPRTLSEVLRMKRPLTHNLVGAVTVGLLVSLCRILMRLVEGRPIWFETERIIVKTSAVGLKVGRSLDTIGEAIEERYYAPSLVLAVVLVLFIFLS